MASSTSLRLLLALTNAFGDVSAEVLQRAWSRWIGPERFRRRLDRVAKAGWARTPANQSISRVVHVTSAGRLCALGGRDPEARWQRHWDGKWRLALFDIPEEHLAVRARLRRKLRELGFGYLQNSVWISPDPADELRAVIKGVEVDVESFTIMDARPSGGETDDEIVRGAWDFARIEHNYAAYLDVLSAAETGPWGTRSRRSWFEVEGRAWRAAIRLDPLLPHVLLPPSYRGREAWEKRQQLLPGILARG